MKGWPMSRSAFHYGNSTEVMQRMDYFACNRLRRWLWHKCGRRGSRTTKTPRLPFSCLMER
jgi:hypothetical protein